MQKYPNKEEDTFCELIPPPERRNSVQKSIFSLIICINRNADTSNNLLGFFIYYSQVTAFSPAPSRTPQSIQRGSQMLLLGTRPQGYGDAAAPGTWHSTAGLHLLLSHPFPSTTRSKRAESSFHAWLQKWREGEKENTHNLHIEGLSQNCSFVRSRVKGRVKMSMGVTLILHQEYITPSVWLHFG